MEKYFVNVEIRTGQYLKYGDFDTHIYKKTTNAFIKYIQEEATFKVNSRFILNNLNYVSFIYLSTEFNHEHVIQEPPTNKELYNGNLQWLKTNYENIYNELIENKQVIVAYMLVYDNFYNTPGCRTIDLIESRIKRNDLATTLINEYIERAEIFIVPEVPLNGTEKFWLKTQIFKGCHSSKDILDLYLRAFKPCRISFIRYDCENLLKEIDKENNNCEIIC